MVCQLGGSLHYRMCTYPVDMRKSFRGLVGIVQQEFGRQLTSDDVYIFYSKNRRTLKLLHREGDGLPSIRTVTILWRSGCLRF